LSLAAEFHLEPGEVENYYTRKSSEACRLSGIQQRLSDGISDRARKWGLPSDLCHRSGKTSNEDDCLVMKKTIIMCRARETIWRKKPMVRM
jgi:hypothetical protein